MDKVQPQRNEPLPLFYSYADVDEDLLRSLEKHLNLLQKQGYITEWHHHKILAGDTAHEKHNEQFAAAKIILLLITADFLASDDSYNEMQQALQRHKEGSAYVIPLLMRPVDREDAPFAHLAYLPRNGKPVTIWRNRDLAFVDIATGIRAMLEQKFNLQHRTDNPQGSISPGQSIPFIFLVAARTDQPLVEQLKQELQRYDLISWADASSREDLEDDERRDVVRKATAIVLVATPRTRRSRIVREQLRTAEMYQRPVYIFWRQGEKKEDVLPSGQSKQEPIDARDTRYTQAIEILLNTLEHQPQTTSSQSPPAHKSPTISPQQPPRNPYKGLRAFGSSDAQDFFGRDQLIQEMLATIATKLAPPQPHIEVSRLLAILGPSGSGKSSTVMAGLLPRLRRNVLPGSKDWVYLDPIVPSAHPLEALALALAPLFPARSLASLHEDLENETARGLHLLVATLTREKQTRAVLIVDQFEEVFTQTNSEQERQQFLDLLLAAITEPQGSLLVIITLRADFYDRTMAYSELGKHIQRNHTAVLPMEIRDLRAIIERPAALPDVQLTFDEDLVGDLLFAVQGQASALPLLQFTLDQLFQKRQGRRLTQQAYQNIGGLAGALARHAEATYNTIPEASRTLVRALFLRLSNPGQLDQDATRRRVSLDEVRLSNDSQAKALQGIIATFIHARLLMTTQAAQTPVLEIGHEALLHEWQRLAGWLYEAREDLHLQKTITEDAKTWQKLGRPDDRLYLGSQLVEAQAWRRRNLPSAAEEEFIQASEQYRKKRITRRALLGAAIGGGTVALTASAWIVAQHFYPPEAFIPQGLPYRGHTDVVRSVAWSPDDKYIASASYDRQVHVWDSSLGKAVAVYQEHTGQVYTVAWSHNGSVIASGSYDKTVRIWDPKTKTTAFIYTKHQGAVYSLAWSHRGDWIASASDDQRLHVWAPKSGKQRFPPYKSPHYILYSGISEENPQSATAESWSPDDTYLAVAPADTDTYILAVQTGKLLHTLSIEQVIQHKTGKQVSSTPSVGNNVRSIAWSHNGKWLATAQDAAILLWDSKGNYINGYVHHTSDVTALAWSPDDKMLASASLDSTVVLWKSDTWEMITTHAEHHDYVWSVAWSHAGDRVATASADKTVWIWNPYTLLSYTRHAEKITGGNITALNSVNAVAWSPDGKKIISGGWDQTAQVWDATHGDLLFPFSTGAAIASVAWSPNGAFIALSDIFHGIYIYDAASGQHLIQGFDAAPVQCISFAPDSKKIAASLNGGTVLIFDITQKTPLLEYREQHKTTMGISWSPGGQYIVSGSQDTTARVWDAETGFTLLTYKGHTDGINSVAWSPDNKWIASGSNDRTVQVWNPQTGQKLISYTQHTDAVRWVAWSPDSQYIASASDDRTVHVWKFDQNKPYFIYRDHSASVNCVAWAPNGIHLVSAGKKFEVKVWFVLR